jgi:hypothetical protein
MSVLALIAPLALTACQSSSEDADIARLGQLDTPLAHDPTDKFEIGPWWSDGTHLLNLRADGGYTIFGDNSRYGRALDRGRWGQQNYGTMWLMPYGGNEPQRIRVAITRIDGRLALQPPGYGTMFPLASPPRVREDDLLGRWNGAMGSVALNADATYQFSPAAGATTADGTILAGHNGRWSLNGDTITLSPTTPSVPPLRIKVRLPAPTTDGSPQAEPSLEGMGGELVRAKPDGA